jgi:hypothetical protein
MSHGCSFFALLMIVRKGIGTVEGFTTPAEKKRWNAEIIPETCQKDQRGRGEPLKELTAE